MLEVKNLHKNYGSLVAVHNLSFTLKPGDIFGFIGSNGAGKTTTIKMVSTLLEPTSGTATLNGADITKNPMEVRRQIGYMPDFFGLYDDIKVWEYLEFFAGIYSIPKNQRTEVIDNVLELTDLTIKKQAFVQSLSRGMQQRLCLARCLIHDPALLLLDEPASGLDPRARAELKELILELARMGKMIIVSSHILPELSDFCNTVGIIEKGHMLRWGPVQDVIRSLQPVRELVLEMMDGASRAATLLEGRSGVCEVRSHADGRRLVIGFEGDESQQAEVLAILVRDGIRVLSYQEDVKNLEHVFLNLTTGAVN
ncbi:MAG TPA: ABC transporter ATP-binding protein [Fimbriimonadaceae bacterium]|nr:ABC transporter ATP-binding protein [Fimbriimonadaceae bacterium]